MHGVLGWPAPDAADCQVRLPVPFRAGGVRPDVSGQRLGHQQLHHPSLRQRRAQTQARSPPALAGPGRAMEGHAVHDREVGRLGCGSVGDRGAPGKRRMAALRRKMVLLAHRRRPGAHSGTPAGRNDGHARPGIVRDAAAARRRQPQPLSDRTPEGQARDALDGERRDSAGGRVRMAGRRAARRFQADA